MDRHNLKCLTSACACVHAQSLQSCPTLCDPVDRVACQAPLSMGFFRQEEGRGLTFPDQEFLVLGCDFLEECGRIVYIQEEPADGHD